MLTVKFTNGEIVQDSPWLSMPPEPIQRVKYVFQGKTVMMEGYEAYNHLVERYYALIGEGKGIRAIYLMGMSGKNVDVLSLNVITGHIKQERTLIGQEYNGRPSTGWKSGISVGIPRITLF